MSKSKKRKPEVVETKKADNVTPWNALFKIPEDRRFRVYAFLVWLLGIVIILWVFRA